MTVCFRHVQSYDHLPRDEATRIVYDDLLPFCQSKGVELSQYGNLNSYIAHKDFHNPSHEYYSRFPTRTLLNIERIQQAFYLLPNLVTTATKYLINSAELARIVEVIQGEHLSNGDLIAAMLMRGYTARFAKKGQASQVNAEFKAKRVR